METEAGARDGGQAASNRPLAGIRVVEVAMWAFVPAAGAILSDMGAEVIKIEPPGGDPIRSLTTNAAVPGENGFTVSWEIYNRGKRSVTLDLSVEGSLDVLHKLLETADVFLTSLLPPARRKLKIDVEHIQARHPNIIYAVGSGQGPRGPDAEKGGFDMISFWGRGGVAAGVTPPDAPFPLGMPAGAFGDCTGGAILAGGIAAAIAQRCLTGKASVVDASLLGSAMWSMQSKIAQVTLTGTLELQSRTRSEVVNPLVNIYRTSDRRYLSICMLQSQRYWAGFCDAIERPDLKTDPQFATAEARSKNAATVVAALDEIFAVKPLAEWRRILATQAGQWDVIQLAGELKDDCQVIANDYMQDVDYGDGRSLKMVSVPMQFNREALVSRPAPELGEGNDPILAGLGYNEDEIIDLKVAGIVY